MGIEVPTYIQDLYKHWPLFVDPKREWAVHIRNIKQAILNSFPMKDFRSLTGMVTGQTVIAGVTLGDYIFDNNHHRSNGSDLITNTNDGFVLLDGGNEDWVEVGLNGTTYGLPEFNANTLLTWVEFTGTIENTTGCPEWVEFGYSYGDASGEIEPLSVGKIYLPHGGIRGLTGFKKTLRHSFKVDPHRVLATGLEYNDLNTFKFWIKGARGTGFSQFDEIYLTARTCML